MTDTRNSLLPHFKFEMALLISSWNATLPRDGRRTCHPERSVPTFLCAKIVPFDFRVGTRSRRISPQTCQKSGISTEKSQISNGFVDFLTQSRAAAHFLGTTCELCHPERSVPTLFPAKIASFRFSRRDAQSRDLSSSLSKTEDLNRAIPNLKSVSSARLCPGGRS